MDGRFLLPGTVKQGYLTKSPPLDKGTSVFKGWKKRWCILYLSQRELFIQYYENEESARGSSPPKSTVSLRFCEKVDVDLEHSSYKNVFGIYLPERVYYFSAPSNFEMNEWVDAICAHLNLRDQSDSSSVSNLYTVGHNLPVVTSPQSHYGSMPLSTSPSPGPPIRNIPSPSFYPSQYGTLSAVHMGSGMSTATYGSTSPLPGRGPPPSPPPPYSGNQNFINNGIDNRNTPSPSNFSIQQRLLPPIPNSSTSFSTPCSSVTEPPFVPPRRSIQMDNILEPPIPPPRQQGSSVVTNLYSSR